MNSNQLDHNISFESSIDWLLDSFKINEGAGSSGWESRYFHPLRGWSLPYPETTGYILVTLYDLLNKEKYRNDEIKSYINSSISWLLGLQLDSGAFPGGHGRYKDDFRLNSIDYIFRRKRNSIPSLFNTGQILRGLVRAFKENQSKNIFLAIERAVKFLGDSINEDGSWKKDAYAGEFSPAYFSYIAKPLIDASKIINEKKYIRSSMKSLNKIILSSNNLDLFIQSMSFPGDKIIHTHTLCYTLHGILECYNYLDEKMINKSLDLSKKIIDDILKYYDEKQFVPGGIHNDLKPDWTYSCLTGNCQLGLILIELDEITGQNSYISYAKAMIDYTVKHQASNGSIPGSYPIYGKYMSFRRPNWAIKYFIDLFLMIKRNEGNRT